MKTRIFIFFLMATSLFISCSQENVIVQEPIVQQSAKWSDAANSNNPYESDSFGIKHNQGLDEVISLLDSYTDHDEWFDSIPYIVEDFVYGTDDADWRDYIANNYPADPDLIDSNLWSLDTILSYASSNQDGYIETLIDSMNSSSNYTELKSEIVIWEASINADIALSALEKEELLQMGNMARYSTLYWYNDLIVSLSPQWDGFSFNKISAVSWSDIIEIAITDVMEGGKSYMQHGVFLTALSRGLTASGLKALEIQLR